MLFIHHMHYRMKLIAFLLTANNIFKISLYFPFQYFPKTNYHKLSCYIKHNWYQTFAELKVLLLAIVTHMCCSLQEVRATSVKYMSDLIVEDSWSHLFMDTLAPHSFVKVQHWNWGMIIRLNLVMMWCCYSVENRLGKQ